MNPRVEKRNIGERGCGREGGGGERRKEEMGGTERGRNCSDGDAVNEEEKE